MMVLWISILRSGRSALLKEESSSSANAVSIRVPHHRGQSSPRTSQSGKISAAGSGFRTGEVEGLVPCNLPENEKKKKNFFPC
ncbi:hypothetical protein [uncultured Victivallis sp.]|uniref:hypothetical protein n=1 Tax=uncultured Victivallis sp. TaxID=354118 RepID=UPI0025DA4792|nr:hypothetical protein [uncultured Victivallis sp.]